MHEGDVEALKLAIAADPQGFPYTDVFKENCDRANFPAVRYMLMQPEILPHLNPKWVFWGGMKGNIREALHYTLVHRCDDLPLELLESAWREQPGYGGLHQGFVWGEYQPRAAFYIAVAFDRFSQMIDLWDLVDQKYKGLVQRETGSREIDTVQYLSQNL